MAVNVRKSFKELKLLNLRECDSLSELIHGYNLCSFGARMLGETTDTLESWIKSKQVPVIIYDGVPTKPLGKLLQKMVVQKWAAKLLTPEQFAKSKKKITNLLVIGLFSERYAAAIYQNSKRAIFINDVGVAKPKQVKDGFYPDVTFADPHLVMPIIFATLTERISGKKQTVTSLIKQLKTYGGTAAEVAAGAQTLLAMVQDKNCTVFLTLSGAMTIAKMGLVVCDMIDLGMVQYIASTGALMAHGLIESVGLHHYKYNPKHGDLLLAKQCINRVTDTLEPEENFDHLDDILSAILSKIDAELPFSSAVLHRTIGRYLSEKYPHERGILKSAYEKNVPVVVPAFIDSEIGNDVYVHNCLRQKKGLPKLVMNMELDTKVLFHVASKAKRKGIFTIGGGVPRNNTQNIAPLIEIYNSRLQGCIPEIPYYYGCRIAPDKMFYGHLSGCTYSEGMSWRKMDPKGQFAEIHSDATIIWPLLVKYVMENI